jgi:hypothetical protein
LVEQRTENPRVGGSNPPPGTTPQGVFLTSQVYAALQHLIPWSAGAACCGVGSLIDNQLCSAERAEKGLRFQR